MVGAVLLLLIGGGAVAGIEYSDEIRSAMEGSYTWPESHQYIADAFPNLIPKRIVRPGWRGFQCDTGGSGRIRCYQPGTQADEVRFSIVDRATVEAVQREFDAMLAEDVTYKTGAVPSRTRPLTHPQLAGEALALISGAKTFAEIEATLFVSFPNEPGRDRYVLSVKWEGHTADEVLKYWWTEAPLGR
ncbi:hypothetical protein [Nocardia sp. NPDC050435]|uniref:hypothetical protein n=1 Tax=Nocardia sp. NPDC050435 TaxID=3155040 RepID=UPI0033ED12D7